jgi:hypothetical protein
VKQGEYAMGETVIANAWKDVEYRVAHSDIVKDGSALRIDFKFEDTYTGVWDYNQRELYAKLFVDGVEEAQYPVQASSGAGKIEGSFIIADTGAARTAIIEIKVFDYDFVTSDDYLFSVNSAVLVSADGPVNPQPPEPSRFDKITSSLTDLMKSIASFIGWSVPMVHGALFGLMTFMTTGDIYMAAIATIVGYLMALVIGAATLLLVDAALYLFQDRLAESLPDVFTNAVPFISNY